MRRNQTSRCNQHQHQSPNHPHPHLGPPPTSESAPKRCIHQLRMRRSTQKVALPRKTIHLHRLQHAPHPMWSARASPPLLQSHPTHPTIAQPHTRMYGRSIAAPQLAPVVLTPPRSVFSASLSASKVNPKIKIAAKRPPNPSSIVTS